MDSIFISRPFNHSQTYDFIVKQLNNLFRQVPAKLLVLPGLPDLHHEEGLTAEGMQQIVYMANKLMMFTLRYETVSLEGHPHSVHACTCYMKGL